MISHRRAGVDSIGFHIEPIADVSWIVSDAIHVVVWACQPPPPLLCRPAVPPPPIPPPEQDLCQAGEQVARRSIHTRHTQTGQKCEVRCYESAALK